MRKLNAMLDRTRLRLRPLAERANKVFIERDRVSPAAPLRPVSTATAEGLAVAAERIRRARAAGAPVILAFGAHTIKNGLGPVLIRLMEQGWITHFATNGAGIIHDWEFAFQGCSSEDVRGNVRDGQFGLWQETGYYINLALVLGACGGLGYGESVGTLVEREGLVIPSEEELSHTAVAALATDPERAAAAADGLAVVRRFKLPAGFLSVPHPFKAFSVQAAAHRLGVPFTGHPMIGHDIIYCHPMNHGAAVGRTALRDFLTFADSVSRLEGGVYLSVGSAVMSPMIFEKSWSMARNLAAQEERDLSDLLIVVADLAEAAWDWQRDGEPPQDHPAYYLRYCKTFSRMGAELRYLACDNRDFLPHLLRTLSPSQGEA